MTAFLSWLYSVSSRVIDWFWYLWDAAVNAVLNAWNWAWALANQAYWNAVAWATGAINNLIGGFNNLFYGVQQWVIDNINQFYSWVTGIRDWLWNEIWSYYQAALDYVNNLINGIQGWVMDRVNAVSAWVHNWVDAIINEWVYYFNPLMALRDRINALLFVTAPDFFPRLLDLVNRGYDFLLLFINDPVGFLTGVIWPYFESMLCYALAAGLGTTKYALPPKPVWRK